MSDSTNDNERSWFRFVVEAIIYLSLGATVYVLGLDNIYANTILAVLAVVFAVFFVIAPIIDLLTGKLTNSTINPRNGAFYTEVVPNRTKFVMRGGKVVSLIRGGGESVDADTDIKLSDSPTLLWWVYESYIHGILGKHPIIPYVHYIWTYSLPRYDVFEEDGKTIFKAIPNTDPRYYSDHVRTQLTTWYFEFKGAEISTIPMTVKGSVQIRITEGKEGAALFRTDSWNTLLDQAQKSVVRGVVRAEVTLDQVIGKIAQDIWAEDDDTSAVYSEVQTKILTQLKRYKVGSNKTLRSEVGLEIVRVDIIDFEPELNDPEKVKLYAHTLKRQEARGRHATGQGEASYQQAVIDVAKNADKEAQATLVAQALLKASEGGQLDALASAFLEKLARK